MTKNVVASNLYKKHRLTHEKRNIYFSANNLFHRIMQ